MGKARTTRFSFCFINSSFFNLYKKVKLVNMQDTNEDTEWNDVLRAKGIIPDKPKEAEINEDDVIAMMEKTIKQKSGVKEMEDMTLDELDELEDEEEERILEQYKRARMAEIKAMQAKSRFGDVREISADDYVAEGKSRGRNLCHFT